VIRAIESSDSLVVDSWGNKVAQVVEDGMMLHVVFREVSQGALVITVYRTSKVKKYAK